MWKETVVLEQMVVRPSCQGNQHKAEGHKIEKNDWNFI
jgi:hypothetical protein